ncbi:MarR family winged helix-turn-helix transcriptional regulator [Pseudonocardia sp. GCM10023141]|uniref:MarR family winged helix-turn-helix transcriptional regulator n=1 Tax=Pseudonocardia sp. GCM10023141 TaxID=3252653 RepID=UPI00360F3574
MSESGPELSPGFWLHHAALTWRAELDARLRPLGLTPTQFLMLAAAGWLEHRGGPPTQQAVAQQAGADRMMTSKVVRTLQERGLLERSTHESDARAVRVSLTASGRALGAQATAIARALDEELFGAEPATLRGTLREIAQRR